jgi:hypothetical protein
MIDPSRLIDELGGDVFESSLLQLARSEGPSSESRRRILAGIAAAGVTTLGTSNAHATGASSRLTVAKWAALALVAAIPAGLWLQRKDETASFKHVPSALKAPASEVKATPLPLSGAQQADAPAPLKLDDLPLLPNEAPATGNAQAPKQAQGGLAEEVAQLQKAKLALKGGNAAQALSELATYAQRFPRPTLGTEALVLRIEALSQAGAGDKARAKSLAEGFLAKNPNSPYAARLRTLVAR